MFTIHICANPNITWVLFVGDVQNTIYLCTSDSFSFPQSVPCRTQFDLTCSHPTFFWQCFGLILIVKGGVSRIDFQYLQGQDFPLSRTNAMYGECTTRAWAISSYHRYLLVDASCPTSRSFWAAPERNVSADHSAFVFACYCAQLPWCDRVVFWLSVLDCKEQQETSKTLLSVVCGNGWSALFCLGFSCFLFPTWRMNVFIRGKW